MMDEFTLSQSQKLAAFSLPPLNSLQLGFVSFSKPTQVCKRLAFIRFLSPLLKGLIKGAPHIIKQSAAHDCYNFVKLSAYDFLSAMSLPLALLRILICPLSFLPSCIETKS
jgi:hypothetical protein